MEKLISIQVHQTNPTKTTKVGALLHEEARENFRAFLQKNSDIFTWSHEDMSEIDPTIIIHRLNVDPQYKSVKQKRRSFNTERYEVIKAEVDKLLKADFIWGVDYLT